MKTCRPVGHAAGLLKLLVSELPESPKVDSPAVEFASCESRVMAVHMVIAEHNPGSICKGGQSGDKTCQNRS
jgi:hypothetical protein